MKHLLVDCLAEHGRRFVKGDGQNHCALGLDAYQQFVRQSWQHIQRDGMGAALQRALCIGQQAAQGRLLRDIAAGREVDTDLVQIGMVEVQNPLAIGGCSHRKRNAQPHRIGSHAQRSAHAGGRHELVGPSQHILN
ncbi:hypothetical protein D3C72_1612980 [compost metagenome]